MRLWPVRILCPLALLLGCLLPSTVRASSPLASVALYYAPRPPLDELHAFDVVVVDPSADGVDPVVYRTSHSQLFAYLSVGEVTPDRPYYREMQPAWFVADNRVWKSRVVALDDPDWRAFFLDRVLEPLWRAGYRGFFLDTLDSYQLVPDAKRHAALRAGLVAVIRAIKQRHPQVQLILNRGFELLDQVKDCTVAVAAESLFQTFDPKTGLYGEVPVQDRQWLLDRFAEVKKTGLPVISIDYVTPKDRALARSTAARIAALGVIPWVTDKDLASLGVGSVEVLPRKILGLYDGREGPDPVYTDLQRLAVMPLNYLGYQIELHDLRKPLPSGLLIGRYAGILIWPYSDASGQRLLPWVSRQIEAGMKVLFLSRFGIPARQAAVPLGLGYDSGPPPRHLDILHQSSLLGYELPVLPSPDLFVPIRLKVGTPLLTLGRDKHPVSDPVALTPWGGYALAPFVTAQPMTATARWVLDPFLFFPRALQLPLQPAPDVTTGNGVRFLFSHIDADGFESRVERPGGPLAVTELRQRILERYRIPTTFSVITSMLGDQGYHPRESPLLRAEARKVFALPWVEAGSHTFSHPFYWQDTELAKRNYTVQYLPLPGYRFNPLQEIAGSAAFINTRLLPPGKRVKLLQWSGDCTPGADALAITYGAGLGNINGGETTITRANNSMTLVAPLGVFKGEYFQVFAPNQNENVYTNDWTGPFYGYRRVIETFQMTDTPRRLKPINIYHHVYSVTKEASRRALEDVYTWALAQKPHIIYAYDYFTKVLDFNRTVVARDGDGWLIRNRGDLRELRLPKGAGYPDLDQSRNILGFHTHGDSRYVHLGPGGEAYLALASRPPGKPWLEQAGASVTAFTRTDQGMALTLHSYSATSASFGNAQGCHLARPDGTTFRTRLENALLTVELSAGSTSLVLVCP